MKNPFGKFLHKEPEPSITEEQEHQFGDRSREEYKPDEVNEEETTTDDSNLKTATFSNEEYKPSVKGFKKTAIYMTVGLVAFGSASAMVMHNFSSNPIKEKATNTINNDGVNTGNAGPNLGFTDYQSLGQYNDEKKQTQKPGLHANPQPVPGSQNPTVVRHVPNRVNTVDYETQPPTRITHVSQPGAGPQSQSTHAKPVANRYASAIAFALGDTTGNTGSVGSDTNTTTNTNSQRVDYSSYSPSDTVLLTGTLVPVTLITGIDGAVSGPITAQVRENVYDSISGTSILIPAGAKLLGVFDGNNTVGRVAVKFTRIMYPDGRSVTLPESVGVDSMGFGGVKDIYSEHTGRAIGASFVTSLLAGLTGFASSGEGSDHRSPGQEAISHAITNVMNTGNEIVKKRLSVAGTATIRPGFEFNVMLNSDIVLDPYYGE